MRLTNYKFFELKGGKKVFRQLPELMKSGIRGSSAYQKIKSNLLLRSKELECEPDEIDLDEDNSVYDVKW